MQAKYFWWKRSITTCQAFSNQQSKTEWNWWRFARYCEAKNVSFKVLAVFKTNIESRDNCKSVLNSPKRSDYFLPFFLQLPYLVFPSD